MYLMLRGQLPFDSNDVETILIKTKKAEISLDDPHWDNISPEGKDLLMRFLRPHPPERIELTDALNHTWLANSNKILPQYVGRNKRGHEGSDGADGEGSGGEHLA